MCPTIISRCSPRASLGQLDSFTKGCYGRMPIRGSPPEVRLDPTRAAAVIAGGHAIPQPHAQYLDHRMRMVALEGLLDEFLVEATHTPAPYTSV